MKIGRTIEEMAGGKYRWRTWLRGHLPWALAERIPKGQQDCGAHQWYRSEGSTWRCYHCVVGVHEGSPLTEAETLIAALQLTLDSEQDADEQAAAIEKVFQNRDLRRELQH